MEARTWSSQPLGLDAPDILDFASGSFVNTTPQAAVRFSDADHGLVVLGLSGKTNLIALRTADGGATWKEESLPADLGKPYLSCDGKFVTVNQWGKGITLLKYEQKISVTVTITPKFTGKNNRFAAVAY